MVAFFFSASVNPGGRGEKGCGLRREKQPGASPAMTSVDLGGHPLLGWDERPSMRRASRDKLRGPETRERTRQQGQPRTPNALWDKTRSFWDINNSLSHKRGSEQSERCERTSNGQASGLVPTPWFLIILDHSVTPSVYQETCLSGDKCFWVVRLDHFERPRHVAQ